MTGALDGLATLQNGTDDFLMADADATPLFISRDCTPYASGFAEYKISSNFPKLAAHYGVTEAHLLSLDPLLAGTRATPGDIEDGD